MYLTHDELTYAFRQHVKSRVLESALCSYLFCSEKKTEPFCVSVVVNITKPILPFTHVVSVLTEVREPCVPRRVQDVFVETDIVG